MNHPVLGVEAPQRRDVLAAVSELPVGTVLDDQHLEPVRQCDQPPAAVQSHGHPGRVLEVRDGVDELGLRVRGEHPFQVVGVHPAGVHRDRCVGRLVRVEREQCAQERRRLGDDHVTRVEHQLGDQVEPLLRPLDDQYVVGGARCAGAGHPLRDLLPERRETVGDGVLQGGVGAAGEDHIVGGLQILGREQGRVGEAPAEGDHRGVRPVDQQFTDRRWLQRGDAPGVAGHRCSFPVMATRSSLGATEDSC